MRAAPWIGSAALIGAVAVTLIGARTQALALASGWQTEAEAAVRALGAHDVQVSVDGRTLRVVGSLTDPAQREGVLAALGTIHGIATVESHLTLEDRQTLPDPPAIPTIETPPADSLERPIGHDVVQEVEAAPSPCQDELEELFAGQIIRFAAYSAAVSDASTPLLEDIAEIMAKCPGTVLEVAGHSDGTGIEELNDSLSRARAEAVRQVLIQWGIEPTRLIAMGYGDRFPIADDQTEAGRMQNRRIELRLREAR